MAIVQLGVAQPLTVSKPEKRELASEFRTKGSTI